jgi:mutator protein MutT
MDARVGTRNDPIQKAKGIIMHPDGLLLLRRVRKNPLGVEIQYYVLPGGAREMGETIEQCMKREILEETGVRVRIEKEFTRLKFEAKEEVYFICKYVDGQIGSGEGPEFSADWIAQRGLYIAEVVPLKKLSEIDLKPYSIKQKLIQFYAAQSV